MIEPIYVYRNLINADKLSGYARAIGIDDPVLDMHVTLAYSRDAVDWDRPAFQMDPRPLGVVGGKRRLLKVDGDLTILVFEARAFHQRWAQFVLAGASFDYPEFMAHVTLGFLSRGVEDLPAPSTELMFGPEIREIPDFNFSYKKEAA